MPAYSPGVADTTVIGRDAELADIAGTLADRRKRAIVIEGPAGIGKSTVWRAAVAAARRADRRVLVVRPREIEAAMPYAALEGLLGECLDDAVADLPPVQRHALDVALQRAEPESAAVDPRLVAAAAVSAFRALSARHQLLICVDDVQWLDAPSADVLRFALRRLSADHVHVLVTWRSQSQPLDLGLDGDDLHRTAIAPLSVDSLRAVVRQHLKQALSVPSARALHSVSGGNPFYALEIARSHPDGDYGFDQPLTLDDVRHLVGRRYAELPTSTLSALATVAAMSDPDVRRVRQVLPDESTLDVAFDLQILTEREHGRLEFTHPLLSAAAYAVVPPRRRREIHTLLAEHAASTEERARHLAVATVEPDEVTAAAVEAGAQAAAGRGVPADAARLAEIAARLTPRHDPAAAGLRRLAAAEWYAIAGDLTKSVDIWTQLSETFPPGEVHAEAIAQIAFRGVVPHERAVALSEQAVAESTTLRGRVRRIGFHAAVASDSARTLAMQREAVAEARSAGDLEALIAILPELGFELALSDPDSDGLDLLREAVALKHQPQHYVSEYATPEIDLAVVLIQLNELTEAKALLEQALEACANRGDADGVTRAALHLCETALRAGHLDEAQHAVELAMSASGEEQASQELCMRLAFAGWVAAHRGDVTEARELLARVRAMCDELGDRYAEAGYGIVRGFLELSLGNAAGAREALSPVLDLWQAIGHVEPGVYYFMPDWLESLIRTAPVDDATDAIARWEQVGRRYDRPFALATAARARGMLLTAQGCLEEASVAFTEALRQHERFTWPHQHARTLLEYGRSLRRAGRRAAARAQLSAALELFTGIGQQLWVGQTRDEIARLGGRTPSGQVLTDAEERVVALVADGRSNRNVAAELSVSVRTVEATLTRAYAKLGVHSRSELAARWRDR
jgi:DNA-binding CsgD family transcriptional regulator/Cdc6-like AAA superfamily ATPase